jgi:predicted metal-dependent enzyme (double-stranded beta helix superfamily)
VNDALVAVDAWMREQRRDDRDLSPDELAALAGQLAGRADLWQAAVRHSADERIYMRLRRDHHLEAWLICWMPSQDTGLHDHDLSAGAVRVVEGRLAEDRMVLGKQQPDTVEYAAGETFAFDASRIHNVRHAGDGPATSLHVYSPPLWRMGYYEIGGDGRLARRAATYVEELGMVAPA